MKHRAILVTGGAGFIGSYVNKLLNRGGYQTVVLDNLSRGSRQAVPYGTFIEGDLADTALLDHIFNHYSIDAVMHFAAFTDVGESVKQPARYYQNNVANTLNLLLAMLRFNVKTLIFSSTAAIFGPPFDSLISEEHPCCPINPYGESKWMVEKMLRDFDAAYGLKYGCLRYFNAAGGDPEGEIKNEQEQTPNLIPRLLLSLKSAGRVLTINGIDYPTRDGTCIRDYIHIADLASAHLAAMQKLFSGCPSFSYNLGTGRGYTIREVVDAAEKVMARRIHVIEGARRAGDPPQLLADSSKAERELGWHPSYQLEEMIKHAWYSYSLSKN